MHSWSTERILKQNRTAADPEQQALQQSLGKERGQAAVLLPYTESYVLAQVNYRELLRCVLPLSVWWQEMIGQLGAVVSRAMLTGLGLPLPPERSRQKIFLRGA